MAAADGVHVQTLFCSDSRCPNSLAYFADDGSQHVGLGRTNSREKIPS